MCRWSWVMGPLNLRMDTACLLSLPVTLRWCITRVTKRARPRTMIKQASLEDGPQLGTTSAWTQKWSLGDRGCADGNHPAQVGRFCLPTLSICPQPEALAVVLISTPPPSPSRMRAIQVCITTSASVGCDSCWSEGKSKSLCTGQAIKMGVCDKRGLVLGREAQHCLSWPPLPPAVP